MLPPPVRVPIRPQRSYGGLVGLPEAVRKLQHALHLAEKEQVRVAREPRPERRSEQPPLRARTHSGRLHTPTMGTGTVRGTL